MSGGTFDYIQHQMYEAIGTLEERIRDNDTNEFQQYEPETLAEFKTGLKHLKLAALYLQRIDWLVAGDDGEDTFHERLRDDLKSLEKEEAGQ